MNLLGVISNAALLTIRTSQTTSGNRSGGANMIYSREVPLHPFSIVSLQQRIARFCYVVIHASYLACRMPQIRPASAPIPWHSLSGLASASDFSANQGKLYIAYQNKTPKSKCVIAVPVFALEPNRQLFKKTQATLAVAHSHPNR